MLIQYQYRLSRCYSLYRDVFPSIYLVTRFIKRGEGGRREGGGILFDLPYFRMFASEEKGTNNG